MADWNATDFVEACEAGRSEAALQLLATATYEQQCVGLYRACVWNNNRRIVRNVMPLLNLEDDQRGILLCAAAERGYLVMVKALIRLGASVIHDDCRPFRFACRTGKLRMAKYLAARPGVNIHAQNDWAFVHAVRGEHWPVVSWLMDTDPDTFPAEGATDTPGLVRYRQQQRWLQRRSWIRAAGWGTAGEEETAVARDLATAT